MWLLRTDCIETKWFNSPDDVPGGYAILSHVWGKKEQTFKDTPQLPEDCDETVRLPSYTVSEKIREFCRVARRDGYQWVWADTCCIDKSSSAELSEAINSMYEYYARARVCYVILVDVRRRDRQPNVLIDYDDYQEFRKSKWHTRGWTLQELLAPDIVVFLDADWHVIGTKAKLAAVLAEATSIPEDVLRLKTELTAVSIAGRMSWASKRKTTRVEDEAYCLMGIFGINMPTLYGEGRAAFVRLQEEIMKQSPDTSLFIWGDGEFSFSSDLPTYQHASHGTASGLLAPAPSAFSEWSNVRFAPDQRPEGVQTLLPTFVPSAHGILSRVPVVQQGNRVVGALLLCIAADKWYIVLILIECTNTRSPQGPLYDVGGMKYSYKRMALFDMSSDEFKAQGLTIEWQDIYIAHRPPSRAANLELRLLNHALFPSLQIPHPLPVLCLGTELTLSLSSACGGLMFVLSMPVSAGNFHEHLVLRFGHCRSSTAPQGHSSGVPWARLSYHSYAPPASDWDPHDHDCSQDHVLDWVQDRSNVTFTRVFRLHYWRSPYIRLSFSPSSHDPDLLILTEVLLSGRRPDDSDDVIELRKDNDIFWWTQLDAASTSSASANAQGRGVDGSSTSDRAVERAVSIAERAVSYTERARVVVGQDEEDNWQDEIEARRGDDNEQGSRSEDA